jgi:transcriptional regulator with XRE-family HTH domain
MLCIVAIFTTCRRYFLFALDAQYDNTLEHFAFQADISSSAVRLPSGTFVVTATNITARQIRAARGLIGWTQDDLGKAAGVARTRVALIEREATNPSADVLNKIRTVLEDAQVEFLPQEGVRFRGPLAYHDDQPGANRRLLEDIIAVASEHKLKTGVNDILIYGLREEDAEKSVGDYLDTHIKRLEQAGLRERILCAPSTTSFVAPMSWYRKLPELELSEGPIHVYGERMAVVQWQPKELVTVFESKAIANSVRAMFDQIWRSRG